MSYVKILDRTEGSLVDHPAPLKENVPNPKYEKEMIMK